MPKGQKTVVLLPPLPHRQNITVIKETCYWLLLFRKENLLPFIQPVWQPIRTCFFDHYSVLFLMNLHSPSKSNTNSKPILDIILISLSFTTGHFHT